MSKKHCKMVLVYRITRDMAYEITNLMLITRQGEIRSLLSDVTQKLHSYKYVEKHSMIEVCVNMARENGDYVIDRWNDFGLTWYAIKFVNGNTGESGYNAYRGSRKELYL